MIHSLRFRLLGMMGVILAISLAAMGVLSSGISRREFLRFHEVEVTDRRDRLSRERRALEDFYRARGNWEGIAAFLESAPADAGQGLVLADPGGKLLAVSPDLCAARVEIAADGTVTARWESGGSAPGKRTLTLRGPPEPIRDAAGRRVASLFSLPRPIQRDSEETRAFVGSVNRWLLAAVLAAAGAGLLLAAATSRRILGPVERLTAAARRMAAGDLVQSVEVRSRDEIGELSRAFNSLSESLSRVERLRKTLVGDVAHELRTPLTNVRCQLEAIADGLAAPTPAAVQSLLEEVLILSRLVDDLQELAVAEAGELRLTLASVPLAEAAENAVRAIRARPEVAALRFELFVPADLPAARVDRERLGQIFRNLLANAAVHTSSGGRVTVSAGRKGELLEVAIRDDGAGIAPEHIPYVFDRFYRADPSRSRATGGAGLGLAIVRQLVAAHGGETRIESEIGKGTSVFFTLPAVTAPSQLSQESSS